MRPYSPRHRSARRYESHSKSRPSPHRRPDEREAQWLALTAIDPFRPIHLEKGSQDLLVRVMDCVCPIGFGQRGLIMAPPGSGKTTVMITLSQAIIQAYPQAKVFCLLIDERPEEVTHVRRAINGATVYSSSSDQSYDHHVDTARQMMQEVMGHLQGGADVVIFIDSLTRLARVHNAQSQNSGRTLSGGVDARALEIPRRIFGSARQTQEKGSLTILGTLLIETGSRMDEVIAEEFKGTGNMEMVLSRDLAQNRIFPAIDIKASRTRKEEILYSPTMYTAIKSFRQARGGDSKQDMLVALTQGLRQSSTNEAWAMLQKS